ncbi:MAG: efflux RND transporter permease subunit [Gammaproteobacteria bacterium]|nr:efflux RND transporter permease subunit [Gammaproteobacteria bacterium]
MNFTAIFIHRPVLAIVLNLFILFFGVIAYLHLPTRLYPKADTAVISITTSFPGADATLIESSITTPIESVLHGIDNLDYVTANNRTGISYIVLHFKVGVDINSVLHDVNNLIAQVRSQLPKASKDPVVAKDDAAARPLMYLNFSSNVLAPEQVSDYLRHVVKPQLQIVSGVSDAKILGAEYAMRIWLNPQLMAAYAVTAADLSAIFSSDNIAIAGGQLIAKEHLTNVKTLAELSSSEEFANIILKNAHDHLVRLQDIGQVRLGTSKQNLSVVANGQNTTLIAIMPSATSNALEVAQAVQEVFTSIKHKLPREIQASIFWDNSKVIYAAIAEVKKSIVFALFCVITIVFIFVGTWRMMLLPLVTIPLALLGVAIGMYLMHFSLNTLTMLALVLAVGLVIDDAIVIAENIARHMRRGLDALQAAVVGVKEVQNAVISMTLTLAAVYLPLGLMGGVVGSLFKEFAFVLALSVIVSGVIALTLSPFMCSKLLQKNTKITSLDKISSNYQKLLEQLLQHKKLVIVSVLSLALMCITLYLLLPKELAPKEDLGTIMIEARAPTAANLSYTEKYTKQFIPIFQQIPEIANYVIVNGDAASPNLAFAILDLKPWSLRKRNSSEIINALNSKLDAIPGVVAEAFNPIVFPGVDVWHGAIEMHLETSGDYAELSKKLMLLQDAIKTYPGLTNVNSSLKFDQEQCDVEVDRDKAGNMGIAADEIASAINLALGQPQVAEFARAGLNYPVIPELEQEFCDGASLLNNLQLRTSSGQMVTLANLVKIKNTTVAANLEHFQQMRSATLFANIAPGFSLAEVIKFLETTSKKILPENMQIAFAGEARVYLESGLELQFIFLGALFVVFLFFAVQFSSFRDPLVILVTTPLAIFGALSVMLITHTSLNIYTEIGLVTLVGLITKHGVLIVTFAKQLQNKGYALIDAIIIAAGIRLRPILMTTAAMVLGAIPLVCAHGAFAVSRQHIGIVIVSGMLIGTLFTLFLLPAIYVMVHKY